MKPHIRSFLLRLWKGRQLVLTVNVSAMSNRVVGKLDWSKLVHVQWSSPKQNESLKQETTAERESCESEAKIIPFHWRYRYGQSVPFQDTTSAYISWGVTKGARKVFLLHAVLQLLCNQVNTPLWTHPLVCIHEPYHKRTLLLYKHTLTHTYIHARTRPFEHTQTQSIALPRVSNVQSTWAPWEKSLV